MGLLKDFVNSSTLSREVFEDVLNNSSNYDGTLRERMQAFCKEVLTYGCVSGIVGSMIYYSDTVPFFERNADEIAYLVDELCNSTGESLEDLFEDFDTEDRLIRDVYNKNLLAWFGYEETCAKLYDILMDV